MNKAASRGIGILSMAVSLGLAGVAVYYFANGRVKHGLLFSAIYVFLFLFGLIQVRAKGPAAPGVK
jgi:hypothetical protein